MIKSFQFLVLALVLSTPFLPPVFAELEDVSQGVSAAAIDNSVNPCDDFYQYSCGNWEKTTQLPADRGRWTRSFNTIGESNLNALKKVLSDYSSGVLNKKDPNAKKLGDFYAACTNEAEIEKNSDAELKNQLSLLNPLKTSKDLPAVIAKLHLEGNSVFFEFGPSADLKNPTHYIAEIDQGGYSLPDPTYFTDPAKAAVKTAFQEYVKNTFLLLGDTPELAKKEADQSFAIELKLASNSLPPDQIQDPTLLYHPSELKVLKEQVQNLDWDQYFKTLQIKAPKITNLTEAKFLSTVDQIIKTTSLDEIKSYLRFRIANKAAPFLNKKFQDHWFEFYGKTISGEKEQKARWKKCTEATTHSMGEALGRAYVESHFSAAAKTKAKEMIQAVASAFEEDLKSLDWLDAKTRAAALVKLSLFTNKIGYPDHWRDYQNLKVDRQSFLKNSVKASLFDSKRVLNKIGGPVNPMEWYMTPQEVNAYYEPTLIQINFPAGILQPPFFSEKYSEALNYGAIGLVIGHEMSHGFDTVGSKFDGHGVNQNWWSSDVSKLFGIKASCMEKQYDQFEPLPGLHVNGHLTVTENIADNGGLKMAYIAYKKQTEKKPEPTPSAGLKMTQDQLFFLSMAQGWCTKYSEASLKKQVSSNPHSPSKYRINGPMMNTPAFAEAFQCKKGSKMAPESRCLIW